MNKVLFPEYNVDYITNVMSLRKPQKQSLQILNSILDDIELSKNIDLPAAASSINGVYTLFKQFEHDFMSLTFALATGVGKTRLMGAFITYLYTQKGIKNFFVVAPNLTIYEKLKNDLGNPAPDNEKYVFRGVSCFAVNRPNILVENDYKKPLLFNDQNKVNIFIFNIAKFNADDRAIKDLNEYLGQSFFNYLQGLDDLVLIMDESHHYRASKSIAAINQLKPVLGLELTATPQVEKGGKTVSFQNVVYEYPLSKAIKDGYTRTPYALTRQNFNAYNFGETELDKVMLNDGIKYHENIKAELQEYAFNNDKKLVKPFVLVVCKNTEHADWVVSYIKSDEFCKGDYRDKVILVHSNQKGLEKEENIQKLLEVEKADNTVEIVVHVNILKEGWDVNNLYTIIPLRTATSKTLREQTVGRGLRLPFGSRTGNARIDSVTITAHDKFDEIIREAQQPDSIFNAQGVIYAESLANKRVIVTQTALFDDDQQRGEILTTAGLDVNQPQNREIYNQVLTTLTRATANVIKTNLTGKVTADQVLNQVKKDLGENYRDNTDVQKIVESMCQHQVIEKIQESEMFLPKLRTENSGTETYIIEDFDLDIANLNNYVPIENELEIKNLLKPQEQATIIHGGVIDFNTIRPEKYLVDEIRTISEIDYEKCPALIQKIVMQFLTFYRTKYTEDKVRNICVMYHQDIINKLKEQLLQHLAVKYDGLIEEAYGIETVIREYAIDCSHGELPLTQAPTTNISAIAYYGAKKSVTNRYKFDSDPERVFALVCENSPEVVRWLRPAPKQFNITYNRGRHYEPDFVVETSDMYYLVEVKGSDRLNDPDVLAKKDRAIKYCVAASKYNQASGHKPFKYLFIPHNEIKQNSTFNYLKDRFMSE